MVTKHHENGQKAKTKVITIRQRENKASTIISYFDGRRKVAEIWAWHEGKYLLGIYGATMFVCRPNDCHRQADTPREAAEWIEHELCEMLGACEFTPSLIL